MSRIAYLGHRFGAASLQIIDAANRIIREYSIDGYRLTLRQLFYQFVSRDLLENSQAEYKRLGGIISDARLAGLIDWDTVEDRTRGMERLPTWASPGEIVSACAKQFRTDWWKDQECAVEVWIEKEALAGVFERSCHELNMPLVCCRGYLSQSEMWACAQRIIRCTADHGQETVILHFGDHDPSGLDMTRDIQDRLALFCSGQGVNLTDLDGWGYDETDTFAAVQSAADAAGCKEPQGNFRVIRVALTMQQVTEHNPPPNPAKGSDVRSPKYIKQFGSKSWELDALEPTVLNALVMDWAERFIDRDLMEEKKAETAAGRKALEDLAQQMSSGKGKK